MKDVEICWNITAKCNQKCKYCHRFLNIEDLNFDKNMKILQNLITSNVRSITWTGGEALLAEGVDELLKKSYDSGIKNKIITNGKLLTSDRIERIYKYLDNITLSIDSIDNDINNLLGRGEEHFLEIEGILNYIRQRKLDVKVNINTVVCKINMGDFENLITFLNKYDIYAWRIFKFMPLRETAIKNKDFFDITMKEFEEVVHKAKNLSKIERIDTRIQEDMEKKYILILADGSIAKTDIGKDRIIGNALKDSIKQFIE